MKVFFLFVFAKKTFERPLKLLLRWSVRIFYGGIRQYAEVQNII